MQSAIQVKSKQPRLGKSIFSVMSSLADEQGAINLSQGFPDFPCDQELVKLLYKYAEKGYNQYAPMPGVPELRRAICNKVEKLYGTKYDWKSEITITAGATEAIYAVVTALIQPGDEVIIFEPWYDAYPPTIRYSGATPVSIQLKLPDFSIDWNLVRKAVNERTKAIIINTPHNPSGAIISENDIKQLEQIVKEKSIYVISDEVYEHIIYDQNVHLSLARFPDLARQSILIGSMGKSFHATGWKVGYCLAPADIMHEIQKIHQFITFSVNTPTQYAYAEYMSDEHNYLSLASFYQKKRNILAEALESSRFNVIASKGTYFMLAGYENISDESDLQFAKRLIFENKIAVIPTSAFCMTATDHKIIRFCFAKKDQTLQKAGDILCKI